MSKLIISTPHSELYEGGIGNLVLSTEPPNEHLWQLLREPQGLTLNGWLDGQIFRLRFDFNDAELQYRIKHGGRTKEPLAKAIGVKANTPLSVIDATAGMGRESFILMSLGCHVTSIERQPIIFLLLKDAVDRFFASCNESQKESWQVLHQNSIEYLSAPSLQQADVVYLDPMFPQREKSAAVKKEMRIFKKLSGADEDAARLLENSLTKATKRVVVKRPKKAPLLNDRKPSFVIDAKKYRFDVYLTQH